jgi:hypothetical protein
LKNPKRFPEIFVEKDFLTTRDDIVYRVIKVDDTTYKVLLEHPVLGKTLEIFELDPEDNTLCLKSVFPSEMQTESEMEVVLDYYNNFLLKGQNTYMDYYNKQVGYFLLSRNIGVFPTSTINDDE